MSICDLEITMSELLIAAHGQGIWDIRRLIWQIRKAGDLRSLAIYDLRDRITQVELAEQCLSIGCTASLIAYRREEPWRYDLAPEGGQQAAEITAALDELRATIIEHKHTISPLLNTHRIKKGFARSFALMCLSLQIDAGDDMPMIIKISGIWPSSQDIQGDAQFECEENFDIANAPEPSPAEVEQFPRTGWHLMRETGAHQTFAA